MPHKSVVENRRSYQSIGPCPICGREMIDGASIDQHHWVPKSQGGRIAEPLHLICHRKIHSVFSRKELSNNYTTPEAIRSHPDIQNFIKWVRRKHPEFIDRHRKPRCRR